MHKTLTFARFGIGDCIGRQSYPQFLFFLERLNPGLELTTRHLLIREHNKNVEIVISNFLLIQQIQKQRIHAQNKT